MTRKQWHMLLIPPRGMLTQDKHEEKRITHKGTSSYTDVQHWLPACYVWKEFTFLSESMTNEVETLFTQSMATMTLRAPVQFSVHCVSFNDYMHPELKDNIITEWKRLRLLETRFGWNGDSAPSVLLSLQKVSILSLYCASYENVPFLQGSCQSSGCRKHIRLIWWKTGRLMSQNGVKITVQNGIA